MASQTHPMRPPPPCRTSNGSMGARGEQLAGNPETGDTRLKPPVGPKPRMLPKPAVPAKPCTPPPSPRSWPPRLEFLSAEKINLLAGPKPYGGSSTALKRLSFGLKSPPAETSNGKGAPPPASRAPPCTMEERLLAHVTPPPGGPLGVLKGAAPFKVKPVAAKPERFPGTTVEEILAKMEHPRKEGLGSPDLAWGPRLTFSPDGSSRFGPKGYAAFRRQPSAEGGEGDAVAPSFDASRESGPPKAQESRESCVDKPVAGRMKREGSPSPIGERPPEPPDGEAERDPGLASRESGSSPAGASCDGDQSGRRKLPSLPGFSLARTCPVPVDPAELSLGATPGTSAGLALAPGAPCLPAEHPASAPGSPAVPAELPALCSPPAHTELPTRVGPGFPGTPESLAKIPIGIVPAPDAPDEPCHRISCSLEAPGEGSPSPSGLLAGLAPGSPDASTEFPHTPPAGQPLASGPPDATAELPHSPPAGRGLAPGAPDVPAELPLRITPSPAPVPSPDTPNLCPKIPTRVSLSPGSPDGPAVSPYSPPSPERGSPSPHSDAESFAGPTPTDENFRCPQLGLRRSSDGVVQLPDKGLEMGVLGGSLAALPRGGPPHSGPPVEGECNWTLSQSFEWAFPSRAMEWEPPRSPIREADDSSLSEQGDSDGESPAPSPKGSEERSSPEGLRARQLSAALDWQDAEAAGSSACLDGSMGAPCDQGATVVGGLEATCHGGPIAQTELAVAELKGPAVVDEADTIWKEKGRPLLGAPLGLTRPEPDQERATPVLLADTPRPAGADQCQEDDLAPVGSCQEGLKPGEAGSEPHPNARWLDELLASPPPSADETKRKGTPEARDPAGPEDLLGWSRKDLCSEFGIRGAHRAGEFGWASEPGTGKIDWPGSYRAGETEQDREFGTGTQDWSGVYKETELLGDSSVGHGNWPDAYGIGDGCRQEGEFSPSKPDWSSQYNIGGADSSDREFSTRKLDWTSTHCIGDSAQQDKRFSTGKPDCTREPGVGDVDRQDTEYGTGKTDWTRQTSVGDTAQQDREFGTSKPDWTHEHGVGDTDQQDREYGTGKPDWTRQTGVGDTAQQDREFGTSKLDWTHERGVSDTDQQDRAYGTGKPDWTHQTGVGDTAQQDREFGTSKLDWTHERGVSDTDQQDRAYGTGKPDWTHQTSVGDIAQQDREFGTSKLDWTHERGVSDTDQQDRAYGTGKPDWTRQTGVGDIAQQDREFGTSKLDWTHEHGVSDTDQQDREYGTGKPDWTHQTSVGDIAQQDREFGTSKLDWTHEHGVSDTDQQDREYGTGKPDWTHQTGVGDIAQQDRELGTSKPDWTREHGVSDTDQQDREYGTGKPDWTHQTGVGDTAQQDRGFGTSKPDWTYNHGGDDTNQPDREFGTSKPDWINMYGADTDQQDRELGTSKLDWTREYGITDTDHQGKEFGAGKPDWTQCSVKTNGQGREWTCEYGVGNTAQQDKPDWTREFGVGDGARQDRAFSPDKPAWLDEYGIHHTDQESAFGSGVGDPDSPAQEPGSRKPGWSGTDWQESKFLFARRDCANDFRIGGAKHESQYGVIGTERASGFGLSALDPSGAIGTLGPAELGESRTDWAGHTRTVDLDEPREAGVGHSDWAQDLGLSGTGPSVGLGAISPEEPSGGWMDWTNKLSMSSMDTSSGLRLGDSDTPREPGVGQPNGASDLGTGGPATASGFESVGPAEARARQTDWSHEFGSGDEGSAETGEAGAGQMDWASEVGIGRGKPTNATAMAGLEPHGDSGPCSTQRSGPSPLLQEMLAKAATQRKSPGEERGLPPAPDTHPPSSPQEDNGGPRPEGDGAPSPSDATDGGWLPIEARRLSQPGLRGSQPSSPGEDFTFLEDMEVLDSTIYRSRANLGRKRGHRAPAMRPAGTLGLSEVEAADWMFQDSTEPREVRWVSSDEEVAEEPRSRRAWPSLAAKGLKVPLFPGLNPSALKAKLRGRNRSAEEGAQLGEAKPAPPKEPHVQRSKSCKIPSLGGKPLVLPPKPEKSSGSDATSPHWLQALRLKKKKS